jgi:hypothetical protein
MSFRPKNVNFRRTRSKTRSRGRQSAHFFSAGERTVASVLSEVVRRLTSAATGFWKKSRREGVTWMQNGCCTE